MAFTVTVIDRHDLETTAGRTCDSCSCDLCICDSCICDACICFVGAAEGQVEDAATVQLSPLED